MIQLREKPCARRVRIWFRYYDQVRRMAHARREQEQIYAEDPSQKKCAGPSGAGIMTGSAADPAALAVEVRALLSRQNQADPFLTYQALAVKLGLTPPGTIERVASALELTMREDVAAGRPMIAALVISRAGDMPRRGFFDFAVALGWFPTDPDTHRAAWQAECAAVFAQKAGGAL